MKIDGKIIVVTGGGNGIGRALVLELLGRGALVAAVDLRPASLEETAALAAAGDRLATFPVDVTDREAVAALPLQVIDRFSAVDGLVNCAGIIQPFVKLIDLDDATIDRVLDVNLRSQISMLRAFLPHLLDREVAHVANVASMGAFLPVPGQTIYGASKAGVLLLTEGLYAELLDTHVGVSVVMPGGVATNITENSGVAMPAGASAEQSRFPTTSPEDAARIIAEGIEHDRLYVHVGWDSRALHALQRIAPKQATRLITKQMASLLAS